jgi:lysophospholipase L1-like esterase
MIALVLLGVLIQPPPAEKWEKEIAAIEARHKADPPPPGGVVFAGSSTIRLWDLKASFPGKGYINVGFGGSQIPDATKYAPRIILPLKPKAIVFYSADNDLNAKRTPEQVRDDFRAFAKVIRDALPTTPILIIGVKPSVKRWEQYPIQAKANGYLKAMHETDKRIHFLDTAPLILGSDGKPRPELFEKDGLHLNAEGYKPVAAGVAKWLEAQR